MKSFISAIDNLPKIAKIILALPFLDIIWGIYRIIKGIDGQNWFTLIIGILWIIPGSFICWILDIVMLVLQDKVLFAD